MSTLPSALHMFWFLQALDVITTLVGLRLGASEGSIFISRAMAIGHFPALLLAKALALLLAAVCLLSNRHRLLPFLNYWFAAVVTWNLFIIVMKGWRW